MKAIETGPIAEALPAYVAEPKSGITTQQIDVLIEFGREIMAQSHVTPAALAALWEQIPAPFARVVKAATLADALAAVGVSAEFAREAVRLFNGEPAAVARPDPQERIAAALELIALSHDKAKYDADGNTASWAVARENVVRNARGNQ